MVCSCKMFTDQRISHRRAASKATREAGPKAEIIKLLEERGIRYWRMQSGDIVQQLGGRRQRIQGNAKGTPEFRSHSAPQSQGKTSKHRGHRRHQNGTKPK